METRYISLLAGLVFAAVFFLVKGRGIGRGGKLPLINSPSGSEIGRAKLYYAICVVLALLLVATLGVWGILSDPQ